MEQTQQQMTATKDDMAKPVENTPVENTPVER
jgi:hypothetical protein